MKLHLLSESFTNTLLLEANVFNVKEEHQGTSIAKFAEFYGNMLSNDNNSKQFAKKISKLLMNDERYHHAMRDVPADAPDWAHTAAKTGELVYFEPDVDLKDKMEHLTHYINALEHDSKQNQDNDLKVFAAAELQGFSKAESLQLLDQKANKYFARGSKKAKGDTSGMKPQLDAGGGYVWYVLEDPEAFKREGKVLQNCIGSHWTAGKCERGGYKIYVMKNPQGESAVAIRINSKTNTVEEIKGKQNQPPVEKYMPYVKKFLAKANAKLTQFAETDLKRAGYYFIEGEIYTKSDAVKKFMRPVHVDKLGFGLDLVKIDLSASPALATEVYGLSDRYGAGPDLNAFIVYEIRRNNHPVTTAVVKNKEIVKVLNHTPDHEEHVKESVILEAVQAAKMTKDTVEFIEQLMQRGLVDNVDPAAAKSMFWDNNLVVDTKNKKIVARGSISDKTELKDAPRKQWEVYNGMGAVDSILRAMANSSPYSNHTYDRIKQMIGDPHEIKSIYLSDMTTDEKNPDYVIVIVDKNNQGHPHEITADYWTKSNKYIDAADKFGRGDTSNAKVKSVIALANHHKFELPDLIRAKHNVHKDIDGKQEIREPKGQSVGTNPDTTLYDLSSLNDEDTFTTIYTLLHDSKFVDERGRIPLRDKHGSDKEYKIGEDSAYHSHGKFPQHVDKLLKTQYKDPDKVYTVEVNYGADKKHHTLVFVKGNKIVLVDDTTDGHKWQKWTDNRSVIEQLNKFAKDQKLKFVKTAIKGAKEFRVDKETGMLHTAQDEIDKTVKRQIDRGNYKQEGTDEIKFSDDSKFVRSEGDEHSKLLRLMPTGSRGEIWKYIDSTGKNPANILVSKGVVKGTFNTDNWTHEHMSSAEKEKAQHNVKNRDVPGIHAHIKTAAEKFGWKIGMPKAELKPNSNEAKMLTYLNNQDEPVTRNDAYNRAEITTKSGQRMQYAYKWDRNFAFDKELRKRGLISVNNSSPYSGRWTIEITDAGKKMAQQLAKGEPAHYVTHATKGIDTHSDWKAPTKDTPKKAEAKKAVKSSSSTKALKTGSKADQALAAWNQHIADNGSPPKRKDFIEMLMADPYNMSASGAATYHYNTKKKADAQQNVAESLAQSFLGLKRLIVG